MKNTSKFDFKVFILDMAIIAIGCFIYAISINCFTDPNDICPGGVTGLAQLLKDVFGLPVTSIGLIGTIINIPIFIWAFIELNWRGLIYNVIATFGLNLAISVTGFLPTYTDNLLIASILGGVIGGFGLGLIFLRGAATGGTDLVATLLKLHIPHIPVGKLLICVDGTVVFVSAIVYGLKGGSNNLASVINVATYSAILIFLLSKVIDSMLYGMNIGAGRMVFIISKKNEEISKKILSEVKRGVTALKSRGVYTSTESEVLMCAMRKQELAQTYDIIKEVDENAFVIVGEAGEITGRGFNGFEKDMRRERKKKTTVK